MAKSGVDELLPLLDALVLGIGLAVFKLGGNVGLLEHGVVAGRAGDTVTRQRTVVGVFTGRYVPVSHRNLVQHFASEITAVAIVGQGMVQGVLALSLDAMTAEAHVLDDFWRVTGIVKSLGLAGELGEEHRVTSGQPHR